MKSANIVSLALLAALNLTISACSVHGGTSDDTSIPAPVFTSKGDLQPAPKAATKPGSKIDLSQCPDLGGRYKNSEMGVDLILEITKDARGVLTINMTGWKVLAPIDGTKQVNRDGSESLGTCKDGRIDLVGKQASGRPFHSQLIAVNQDVSMYDLDVNDSSQVLTRLLFKAK